LSGGAGAVEAGVQARVVVVGAAAEEEECTVASGV